ncbi:MAG: hypothetical protein ACQESR_01765 [Planctomycetota bacterium]
MARSTVSKHVSVLRQARLVKSGGNRRGMYISGGWIYPGGTLPDASRPPVGRTRGGQSHPRSVYYQAADAESPVESGADGRLPDGIAWRHAEGRRRWQADGVNPQDRS